MCNPLAIIGVAAGASTVMQYSAQRKADKARNVAAAQAKDAAQAEKTAADLGLRDERRKRLQTSSRAEQGRYSAVDGGFSPRSFFRSV